MPSHTPDTIDAAVAQAVNDKKRLKRLLRLAGYAGSGSGIPAPPDRVEQVCERFRLRDTRLYSFPVRDNMDAARIRRELEDASQWLQAYYHPDVRVISAVPATGPQRVVFVVGRARFP